MLSVRELRKLRNKSVRAVLKTLPEHSTLSGRLCESGEPVPVDYVFDLAADRRLQVTQVSPCMWLVSVSSLLWFIVYTDPKLTAVDRGDHAKVDKVFTSAQAAFIFGGPRPVHGEQIPVTMAATLHQSVDSALLYRAEDGTYRIRPGDDTELAPPLANWREIVLTPAGGHEWFRPMSLDETPERPGPSIEVRPPHLDWHTVPSNRKRLITMLRENTVTASRHTATTGFVGADAGGHAAWRAYDEMPGSRLIQWPDSDGRDRWSVVVDDNVLWFDLVIDEAMGPDSIDRDDLTPAMREVLTAGVRVQGLRRFVIGPAHAIRGLESRHLVTEVGGYGRTTSGTLTDLGQQVVDRIAATLPGEGRSPQNQPDPHGEQLTRGDAEHVWGRVGAVVRHRAYTNTVHARTTVDDARTFYQDRATAVMRAHRDGTWTVLDPKQPHPMTWYSMSTEPFPPEAAGDFADDGATFTVPDGFLAPEHGGQVSGRDMWLLAYGYALGAWHALPPVLDRDALTGPGTGRMGDVADVVAFADAYGRHHDQAPVTAVVPVTSAFRTWLGNNTITGRPEQQTGAQP